MEDCIIKKLIKTILLHLRVGFLLGQAGVHVPTAPALQQLQLTMTIIISNS